MLDVVAGIISQDDFILICQRHEKSRRCPLKWEFPGGKVEINESREQAVRRELNEELGICVKQCHLEKAYEYAYPGENALRLSFFVIDAYTLTPSNLIFQKTAWVLPKMLSNYDFLDGDKKMIGILQSQSRS